MFSLHRDDVQSRSSGSNGEDVILSEKARKLLPVSIECKNRKAFSVYKDYEQAEVNNPDHDANFTIVCIKQNNARPLVLIDAEDFFKHIMSRLTW